MRRACVALALLLAAALVSAQSSSDQTTQTPSGGTGTAAQAPSSQPATGQQATGQPATSQSAASQPGGQPAASQPATAPEANAPAPYEKGEFPDWAQDLWRAEVIFVGSLPFSIFFTLETYDFIKYAGNGFQSTPTTPAPWPFTSATDIKYSTDEQLWLIFSAATVSLLVSGADFLIRRFFDTNAKR